MLSLRGAISTNVAMMECASGQNMSGGCVFLLSELEKVWVTLSVLLRQLLLSPSSHACRQVRISHFGSFWTEPRLAVTDIHKRGYEIRVLCFGINDSFATRYGVNTANIPRDDSHKSKNNSVRIPLADIVSVCNVPAQIAQIALKEFFLYIGEGLYRHRVFRLTFPGIATIVIKRERYMLTPDISLMKELFTTDSHKWPEEVKAICYAKLCALMGTDKNIKRNKGKSVSTLTNYNVTPLRSFEREHEQQQQEQEEEEEELESQELSKHQSHIASQHIHNSSSQVSSYIHNNNLSEHNYKPELNKERFYSVKNKTPTVNSKQRANSMPRFNKAFVAAAPSGRLFADIEQETRRRRNTEYYMNEALLHNDTCGECCDAQYEECSVCHSSNRRGENSIYAPCNTNKQCNLWQQQEQQQQQTQEKQQQHCQRLCHYHDDNSNTQINDKSKSESIYKLKATKSNVAKEQARRKHNGSSVTSDEPEIEAVEIIDTNVERTKNSNLVTNSVKSGINNKQVINQSNKSSSLTQLPSTESEQTMEQRVQAALPRPLYRKDAELEGILRHEERFSRPISRHAFHEATSARELIYHWPSQSDDNCTNNECKNINNSNSSCNHKNNNSCTENNITNNNNNDKKEVINKQKKQEEYNQSSTSYNEGSHSHSSQSQRNGRKRFSASLTGAVDHVAPLMKIREY